MTASAKKTKTVAKAETPSGKRKTPSHFEDLYTVSIKTGSNVRKDFDKELLNDLTESIRNNGVLEPLIVHEVYDETKDPPTSEFFLIAGERRLRASELAGLEKVPCVVYHNLSDQEFLEIMLSENLLRADLNPLEEANGLQKLLDFGLTQEDLGTRIGRSQEYISNRLRLLKTSPEIQKMIISREITPGHFNVISQYSQYGFFDEFVKKLKAENKKRFKESNSYITIKELAANDLLYSFLDSSKLKGTEYIRMYDIPSEFRSDCKDCAKCVRIKYTDYCFDKECFPKKVAAAKQQADERAALAAVVDLDKETKEKAKAEKQQKTKEHANEIRDRLIPEFRNIALNTDLHSGPIEKMLLDELFRQFKYSISDGDKKRDIHFILYDKKIDEKVLSAEEIFRSVIFSGLCKMVGHNGTHVLYNSRLDDSDVSAFVSLSNENGWPLSDDFRSFAKEASD